MKHIFCVLYLLVIPLSVFASYATWSTEGTNLITTITNILPTTVNGALSIDNKGPNSIQFAINDPTYFITIDKDKNFTVEANGRFYIEKLFLRSVSGTNSYYVGGY